MYFRESIKSKSKSCLAKSPNHRSSIWITAQPLNDIDTSNYRDNQKWISNKNILINLSGIIPDDIKKAICNAYDKVCKYGPLLDEMVTGICFTIDNIIIGHHLSTQQYSTGTQMFFAAINALYASILTADPIILFSPDQLEWISYRGDCLDNNSISGHVIKIIRANKNKMDKGSTRLERIQLSDVLDNE